MKIDLNNLTTETNLLHQIITDLVSEVLSLTNKNISLEDQLTHLQEQLALLKKQRFGQSSEKLDNQIAELEAKIEECELLEAASDRAHEDKHSSASEEKKQKNTPKRRKLPENLERIDEVLNPEVLSHLLKFRHISVIFERNSGGIYAQN